MGVIDDQIVVCAYTGRYKTALKGQTIFLIYIFFIHIISKVLYCLENIVIKILCCNINGL